jgi:hypothetical protein
MKTRNTIILSQYAFYMFLRLDKICNEENILRQSKHCNILSIQRTIVYVIIIFVLTSCKVKSVYFKRCKGVSFKVFICCHKTCRLLRPVFFIMQFISKNNESRLTALCWANSASINQNKMWKPTSKIIFWTVVTQPHAFFHLLVLLPISTVRQRT